MIYIYIYFGLCLYFCLFALSCFAVFWWGMCCFCCRFRVLDYLTVLYLFFFVNLVDANGFGGSGITEPREQLKKMWLLISSFSGEQQVMLNMLFMLLGAFMLSPYNKYCSADLASIFGRLRRLLYVCCCYCKQVVDFLIVMNMFVCPFFPFSLYGCWLSWFWCWYWLLLQLLL